MTKIFFDEFFKGRGDFTKERQERLEPSYEDIIEEMRKINPEEIDLAFGKKQK